jgi:hypothetical protein
MRKQPNDEDKIVWVDIIKDAAGIDALTEIFEVGSDTFFKEGVAKELPILGSALSIVRAISATRNQLFLNKIMRFMSHYDSIDQSSKDNLIERIKKDSEYKKSIGETVFAALERFDKVNKADAYGLLFVAYIKKECNHREFVHYTDVIQNINWDNIDLLKQFYTQPIIGGEKFFGQGFVDEKNKIFLQSFVNSGLVMLTSNARKTSGQVDTAYPGTVHIKTSPGEEFLKLLKLM